MPSPPSRRSRRSTRAGLAGVLLALASPAAAQTCGTSYAGTVGTFDSGGRSVPVEIFRPAHAKAAPAVLLLHGRSGLPFYGERLRLLACELNAAGLVAVVPSYFAATAAAEPPVTDANVQLWETALADALSHLSRLEGVDASRVGVAGFSLGGYLGSVRAARDPRIRAFAMHGAGLSSRFPKDIERMPPVLILHVKDDPIVPVAEAEEFAQRLRARNLPVGITLYAGREHILSGEPWRDAVGRLVGFFKGTL